MRMQTLQVARTRRSVNNGPLVVLGQHKKIEGQCVLNTRTLPAIETHSTHETGPPGGSGPPSGTGPPRISGWQNGHNPPLNKKMAELVKHTTRPQEKQKNQSHKRKEKMKSYKPIVRIGQIIASGLLMLQATTVFAAAGDSIANRATLTFNGGLVIESDPLGNSAVGAGLGGDTNFIEDRVINFTVAETTLATQPAATGSTGNVLTFTVTNNGNGTQDFLLAAVNNVGGTDPFSATLDTFESTADVFVDQNANGTYEPLIDVGLYIADLGPTQSETVFIVSTMPGALADGVVSVVSLVAQAATPVAGGSEATAADAGAGINDDDNGSPSPAGTDYCNGDAACNVAAGVGTGTGLGGATDIADDPTTEQIVFNDAAGATAVDEDSDGGQDTVKNGQASDAGSYTIASAVLTVTKTALPVVFDSINLTNNPKAIPGATAYIPYTITISNAGPTSAFLTDIQDVLGATLAIDPDFTSDGGTTFESAAGDTFEVDTTATSRTAAGAFFCTGDVADADVDGCGVTALTAAATLTVGLNVAATNMAADAPASYLAGELKAGDSITIRFQVIMQ